MRIETVSEFLTALRQYDLLEPSQWTLFDHQIKGRFRDLAALGQEVVRRGWLTEYQLNMLLQGSNEIVIGNYRVLDWLGEGGVSRVLKALHIPTQNIVALKLLRPKLQDDVEAMRQFQFEVRVTSQLSHPNIVSAFEADPMNQPYMYALEYVEGVDLGRYVEENGALPSPQACDYIRQAARGLQYAYEHGVVHRDIKPANILLTSGGDVIKILDMGLARMEWKRKGSYAGTPSDTANIVMGTPDYVAPEQATRPKDADIRADIYSLGCTLHFLLCGQPPFPVRSIAQKLVCHQQTPPPPIDKLCKDAPAGLTAVLQKMMAKAPADRYRTPASVALALGAYCRGSAVISR